MKRLHDPSEVTYYLYRWLPRQKWSLSKVQSIAPFQIPVIGYEQAIAEQKRLNEENSKKEE